MGYRCDNAAETHLRACCPVYDPKIPAGPPCSKPSITLLWYRDLHVTLTFASKYASPDTQVYVPQSVGLESMPCVVKTSLMALIINASA